MKGLTIDFKLKRVTKLNKITNYLLVLALFIIAMLCLVYLPYVDCMKAKNEALRDYRAASDKLAQEQAENDVRVTNSAADKAYQSDFIILQNSLGVTQITYEIEGVTYVVGGERDDIEYYTTHQDKISYILAAISAFNEDYEAAGISASIGGISINSLDKTIRMDIAFAGDTLSVNDARLMMSSRYISKAYLPFLVKSEKQTGTTGIDEGLELTLVYA